MALHIKHAIVKFLAGLLRGLGSVRTYVAGFFHIILSPIVALAKIFFHWIILPLYRLLLVLRRLITKALIPAKNSLLSLSAHRYVVHALVIVIVMAVSVFNVRSFTAHSESFGESSVLTKLMNGDIASGGDTVEEIVDLNSEDAPIVASVQEGALSANSMLVAIGEVSNSGETSESIGAKPTSNASVPSMISPTGSPATASVKQYTVQDGDTLWDISRTYDIDVPTLIATNDLGPRAIIRPGDVIRLVSQVGGKTENIVPAAAPTFISATSTATRTKIEMYKVQDGDTLWDISKTFGIDVPTLLATNDLGPRGIIRPGDSIKILPVSGVLYTVKKGDNVGSIAKKYAIETSDILKANKLTESSTVNVGDELIVPGGSADATPVAKPKPIATTKPVVATRTPTAAPVETLFKPTVKPADTVATGAWVWPTVGHLITQAFRGKSHTGIDIDGSIGSANYAAHDGVVEFAGWSVGYGLSIVINHGNGLWTRYGHNSQIFVKIGDQVKAGQNIALMGTTGTSSGSHLHFEVLSGPGKFLNPLKYVRK